MDVPYEAMPAPPILTTMHPDGIGIPILGRMGGTNMALGDGQGGTWPVANQAYFYPFRMFDFAVARYLLWPVGAVSAGNIDIGIYDASRRLIVAAGSTAMSATVNATQQLDIPDTELPPGDYLLGGVCSSTSGTCFQMGGFTRNLARPSVDEFIQASAFPLPNPCVPVRPSAATSICKVFGIQFSDVF